MIGWLIVKFAGGFWVLWGLFVVVLVSTLKEIDPASWHYRLVRWSFSEESLEKIKDTCSYRTRLLWLPLKVPLLVVFRVFYVVVHVIGMILRIFWDWFIRSLIMGDRPDWRQSVWAVGYTYRDVNYFEYVFEDPVSDRTRTRYTRFTMLSPLAYACIVGVLFSLVRTVMHYATPVEFWLSVVFLALVALIIGFVVYAKFLHDPVSERWKELRGKLCRPLPIKEGVGSVGSFNGE